MRCNIPIRETKWCIMENIDEKLEPSAKPTAIKEIHYIEKLKFYYWDLLFTPNFLNSMIRYLFKDSFSSKSDSYLMDKKQKPIPKLIAKEHNDR